MILIYNDNSFTYRRDWSQFESLYTRIIPRTAPIVLKIRTVIDKIPVTPQREGINAPINEPTKAAM